MFYFSPEVRTDTRDPGMCAYHHVLIGGRYSWHFVHCWGCPASKGTIGHDSWFCWDCKDEGRGDEAWLYPAGHDPKFVTQKQLYPGDPKPASSVQMHVNPGASKDDRGSQGSSEL